MEMSKPFSREFFEQSFNQSKLDATLGDTLRLALQHPRMLYLMFQRYTYFNAYTSSVISRLASSIAMSRYLFTDSSVSVIEEADRGFDIAMKVMIAGADEGANGGACHRGLAQLLLKTIGDYAEITADERNQVAHVPTWLDEISQAVMENYQGTPGDVQALIRSIGFHAASELSGDMEYALVDKIVYYESRGSSFEQYLRQCPPAKLSGHSYHPWCYVLIHSRHEGAGVEASHFECVVDALNLVVQYRPESVEQITQWVMEGFQTFIVLIQELFTHIQKECQAWLSQQPVAERELLPSV